MELSQRMTAAQFRQRYGRTQAARQADPNTPASCAPQVTLGVAWMAQDADGFWRCVKHEPMTPVFLTQWIRKDEGHAKDPEETAREAVPENNVVDGRA